MIFDNDNNIRIHQSWLDDAMRCGERGRLGIVAKYWSGPSDATALGTGAHAAAEAILNGLPHDDAVALIEPTIASEIVQPAMRWNKYDDLDELVTRGTACFEAWYRDILPTLPAPGTPEVNFLVWLYELEDGRKVGIEGQIDYVPHEVNELWDWKFPGKKYNQKAKQKGAIQPTIYGLAAVMGGLSHVTDFQFTWPLPFRYGLGVTMANANAQAQQFDTVRTQAHADFAVRRIKQFVDLALNFGLDQEWPMDDDHFLCSAKWCPWWSICKGANLTWQDDLIPEDRI